MKMGGWISVLIRSLRRLQPFTPPEDSMSQEVSSHHTQYSLLIDPGVPRIPIWESPSLWHFSAEMDGGSGINTWSLWEMCIPGLCRKLHSPQISSGVFKKWYPPFHTVLITFWTASRGGNNDSPTGINFMLIIYVSGSHSCCTEARILQISCFLIWERCGMGQKQWHHWGSHNFLDLLISLAVLFYHFIRRWFGA